MLKLAFAPPVPECNTTIVYSALYEFIRHNVDADYKHNSLTHNIVMSLHLFFKVNMYVTLASYRPTDVT